MGHRRAGGQGAHEAHAERMQDGCAAPRHGSADWHLSGDPEAIGPAPGRSGGLSMGYAYPVDLLEEADGVTVTALDIPELVTCGDTRAEALARAEDALVMALSFYTDEARPLPRPSPANGRPVVGVPALVAAKLALHDAMLAAGVSNVELSRMIGLDEKAVRRLRDPLHRSHIGSVETALRALGQRLDVQAVAA